jgi:O-methyltransferase involved in polyketide biosynthesis
VICGCEEHNINISDPQEKNSMKTDSVLDPQSVQATMLLPLWGRAKYSELNADILDDKEAIEIIKGCGYDFSAVDRVFGEYAGLCYIYRARKIDDAVRAYISKHPRATVVNIGAGLDTTFSRVDNGQIRWYNLDLPDATAFRRTLIPDSAHSTDITKSFFDMSWFDDIMFNKSDGVIFLSAGVFYYFHEEEIKSAVREMAHRFPGGELHFDAQSKTALGKSNSMVRKTGNTNALMYFYVNNAKSLESWSPEIESVSCEPFFRGIPKKKHWSSGTKLIMSLADTLGMAKFVCLRFASE